MDTSVIETFIIKLNIHSGNIATFSVKNVMQDLKPNFIISLEGEQIATLLISEHNQWIQTSGNLLSFEVKQAGAAIEDYYQKALND